MTALHFDDERIASIAKHAAHLAREAYETSERFRAAHCDPDEAAASAAISVACTNIAGVLTPDPRSGDRWAALVLLTKHLRNGSDGAQRARWHLDNFTFTHDQRTEKAAGVQAIADVLERCGVDLHDRGRTVRELRAYVAAMQPDSG